MEEKLRSSSSTPNPSFQRTTSRPLTQTLYVMNSADNTQAITTFMADRAGVELLASSRGMNFGGAGATLALILLIAQIGVAKSALVWSLGLAAVAFPLWLSLALTYEIWLALKLGFGDLWSIAWLRHAQAGLFYLSGLLTAGSIGCLVFALVPELVWVFVASCVVGVALVAATMVGAGKRLASHFLRRQP
jgi:hypothetical protein